MDNKENSTDPETQVEEIEISETSEPAEPTIVSEPTEVPAQTISQLSPQSEQPLFAKQPKSPEGAKPKKKIGILIAICLAAILLIGGGVFAVFFFSWRNSDPIIVLDAVTSAMGKTKAAISGTMSMEFNEDYQDASGVKSMKLTLDTDADGTNVSVSGNSTLTVVTADDKTTEIDIGGAFVSDGTVYFKIDGIKESLAALDLPDEAATIMGYLEDLIDDVDGQWYKIQISDFDFDAEAKESYQCMVDAINESVKSDNVNELVDLYNEYPFIVPEKHDKKDSDGNTIYNISWDADYLAGYLNGVTDTKAYESIISCTDSSLITDDDVTPKDVAMPDDMPTLNLHISDSRELRGFSANYEKDGNSLNAEFYFEYDDEVNVEIPSDAKSISDLKASIEKAFTGVVTAIMREQVITQCAAYITDDSLYDECVAYYNDALEEYLENMDFGDLFQLSTGSINQEV